MDGLLAEKLTKSYPIAGGDLLEAQSLEVLRDASMQVAPGENHAIVGPSGCGKSTLLAILGSLDRPTSGNLTLNGVDPFALDQRRLAKHRADSVGFVFQEHHLMPQCTVLENALVPFLVDGSANSEQVETARQLLERVGLGERLNHRPAELSGGERQRTAIARALVRDPALLLADEPTGNLDQTTAEAVTELLVELQQEQGKMLVVVTHSQPLASRMQQRWKLDLGVLQRED